MMGYLKEYYLVSIILIIITTINLGDASRLRSQLPNNYTLKTIKSEDGDVIDCVDIFQQPAFNHPLLKDHKIKMRPSNYPEGLFESYGKKEKINQLWQLSGSCPEATIPIRRAEKRNRSLTKKPRNINPRHPSSLAETDAVGTLRHEYAITTTANGDYYGAKATISVWNPSVENSNEFSLSQLWVLGGTASERNTIEAGWTVDPAIFGDDKTRIFVYWTRDNYQYTGCYNLRCPGFVQTSNEMAIGASIASTGNQEISLLVWKDKSQDVWWLKYNNIVVGYWPNSIFTILKGSASLVQWGGEIINSSPNGLHTATQMGSGRFAENGLGSASYFRNLEVVNNANALVPPASIRDIATNPNCYNIVAGMRSDWGNFFYYGGPGRNPNCP